MERVRIGGKITSVFDARKIASRPPASAGLVPAERQLICYRMTSVPPLSFPLASRVGRRVGEGIFALPGSWPAVIPTGASPAEIGKHRSYFSPVPKAAFMRLVSHRKGFSIHIRCVLAK